MLTLYRNDGGMQGTSQDVRRQVNEVMSSRDVGPTNLFCHLLHSCQFFCLSLFCPFWTFAEFSVLPILRYCHFVAMARPSLVVSDRVGSGLDRVGSGLVQFCKFGKPFPFPHRIYLELPTLTLRPISFLSFSRNWTKCFPLLQGSHWSESKNSRIETDIFRLLR